MKEDYIEQNNGMNLGRNNHPNIYGGKGYKKIRAAFIRTTTLIQTIKQQTTTTRTT